MGYIFIIPGGMAFIAGGFWAFLAFNGYSAISAGAGDPLMGRLIIAAPGVGILLLGLLVMASGAALLCLANIERHAIAAYRLLQERGR